MRIYSVGREELDDDDLQYLDKEAYEYLIYSYEAAYYGGSGAAVLKDNNGKFILINLGHCSCFGPLEERALRCIYSRDEITKLLDKRCKDKYDEEYIKSVTKKFKEIEGLN